VSDTSQLENSQYIDNRRRDRPGPASARVEEASEQGTSPLHPRAPCRRHLPRPRLQRSSPARSRQRTPIELVPPRGRPGKLPAARGAIGARSSCRTVAGAAPLGTENQSRSACRRPRETERIPGSASRRRRDPSLPPRPGPKHVLARDRRDLRAGGRRLARRLADHLSRNLRHLGVCCMVSLPYKVRTYQGIRGD